MKATRAEKIAVYGPGGAILDSNYVAGHQAYSRARHGANAGEARASTSLFNPKVGPITQWRRFKYNNRKHPLSCGELEKIDPGLATEIKDLSFALGYNISSSEG